MSSIQNAGSDIRSTAELLINNAPGMSYRPSSSGGSLPPGFDISRTHSINLISEEFLGGYMHEGRMSVVRRFFCLFVTFDLVFVSLLWLICTLISGDTIYKVFEKEIVHYSIYKSLFDVVFAAILRFLILIFFYALLYVNHWFVIALSTSGSCFFLISKVFVFDWVNSSQQVFQVILILTSFVLAWGEAWFLDCRVIPQERHTRRYFNSINNNDRSPLIAPFLASQDSRGPCESVANFYSPLDSAHNSDDEEDEEYHKMGIECIQRVSGLLESNEWKVEKVTGKGDTIHTLNREKFGKIYKLTARLKYPAKALMDELFYRVEDVPKWNPTVIESKLIKKINSYTDISYQTSAGGGGGLVKSRDFVNLRCWRLVYNNHICDEEEIKMFTANSDEENLLNRSCESSVSTISGGGGDGHSIQHGSSVDSTNRLSSGYDGSLDNPNPYYTLSKSLGARGFVNNSNRNTSQFEHRAPPPLDFEEPPPLDDSFHDANETLDSNLRRFNKQMTPPTTSLGAPPPQPSSTSSRGFTKDHVWISAAISIPYESVPPNQKYTRGQNLITGFAFREIVGKPDVCIMEWILCLDLKGYIPRYVLDTAYTTFMSDYMMHLRKYINEMKQKQKRRLPKNPH